MSEFFLELFSEEIPSRLQINARNELTQIFKKFFDDNEIIVKGKINTYSTPNRLIVHINKISKDVIKKAEEIRGPNINAPEKALEGFLKSNKISKEKVFKKSTEKGIFYFYNKPSQKIKTYDLLKESIASLLLKISWKKSMKWGNHDLYWGRPLKSILSLFDKKIIEFKLNHLQSSNKTFIDKENFFSNIITLKVDGSNQNVLPREIKYHILTDEPIHVDFLRVLPGVKIKIEIPVNFINHEKSPGLKKGGVLNIVRRKVELKCPSEKIPENLTLDLDGVDIGESFKISSVKLDPEVVPTIQGRDFVIATLAAPTVMKEPEKPAEAEAAEGEEGAEGATAAAADGDKAAPKADKGAKKEGEDKKPADKKPPEEKK